jgi:DNA modification methylase/superfamily II DNA or RNA helicase
MWDQQGRFDDIGVAPGMTNNMTYDQFIDRKTKKPHAHGFEPVLPLNPKLFDWQQLIVRWAVRQGRCALFEECGLGKTFQQLEWARQVVAKTGGSVLILAPLGVAKQTEAEGNHWGIDVRRVMNGDEVGDTGIFVTNYERLHLFDTDNFAGVVLDESSILRDFMGKTRIDLTRRFAATPYRLCCTATPAPNDYMEFGQQAEFLGVMASNEMLSRWFINDSMNFGSYHLKGHAVADFWRWVSTWAACVTKPSDIGFKDDGFILPKLHMHELIVSVDQVEGRSEELFRNVELSATNIHREMRLTCPERSKRVTELVQSNDEPWVIWCNTNYEADELTKLIPDAIEVRGSDSIEQKEARLDAFASGNARVIITKPSIAGHGLNWQHCHNHAFVGLSYSFEDFYQAMRRGYRFGQKHEFQTWIIRADTEGNVLATVKRKMKQHEEMIDQMKLAAECLRNDQDMQCSLNRNVNAQEGANWKLYNGDCVRMLQTLADNSVDFSVYSPPFANLYIYSSDIQDMGNCDGDDEFMEQYGYTIAEKFRVTKPGCLSAVHCKNLVLYKGRDGAAGLRDFRGAIIAAHERAGWTYHSEHVIWKDPVIEMQRTKAQGLLFKQLCQDSRFSRSGLPEYVLVFRKWGDGMENGAVNHPPSPDDWQYIGQDPPEGCHDERQRQIHTWQKYASPVWMDISQTRVLNGETARDNADEKHICPLQLDVIDRCLWLYTNKGDLVLSPFAGIGSEGVCALKMRRRFIGAELKPSYWKLACDYLRRAEAEAGDLFEL